MWMALIQDKENLHCSDYPDTAGVGLQIPQAIMGLRHTVTLTFLTDVSVNKAGDAIIIIIGIFVMFRCDTDAGADAALEKSTQAYSIRGFHKAVPGDWLRFP